MTFGTASVTTPLVKMSKLLNNKIGRTTEATFENMYQSQKQSRQRSPRYPLRIPSRNRSFFGLMPQKISNSANNTNYNTSLPVVSPSSKSISFSLAGSGRPDLFLALLATDDSVPGKGGETQSGP